MLNLAFSVVALTTLLGSTGTDEEFLVAVGEPAPPFSMRDLDRKMFSLASHTGETADDPKKAVLISFFATWCKPCIKEIPIIKRLHRRWSKHGVAVVYIGLSQGQKELGPFAKKQKMPWPVVPDTFGLLSRRYGATQLPHVILVDGAGKIAFQHRGIAPDLEQRLDTELAKLSGKSLKPLKSKPLVQEQGGDKQGLTMARPPASGQAAERWAPLALYIQEGSQHPITMDSPENYAAFEKSLKEGAYDIANAGPLLCAEVQDKYEPVVRIERQGSPTYLGMVFSTRDSGLKTVKDLKGKTIALVSKHSTSGGLYPLKALLDAGLVPGKDVKIQWLGSHAKVAQAVKDGKADAGGCFEDCRDLAWKRPRLKKRHTRVLGYTREIPAEMLIVRRDLDDKVKSALRKTLLKAAQERTLLNQISAAELPITGIVEASDKDLESVAKVAADVEKISDGL